MSSQQSSSSHAVSNDDHEEFHQEHEEHEEGEPWLVSYADLMTLLFGFFVLMYSFAAAKIDENSEDWIKVKKEVSRFFNGKEDSDSKEKQKTDKKAGADGAQTGAEVLPVFPFDARLKQLAGIKSEVQASEVLQREMNQQGIVFVTDAGHLFTSSARGQRTNLSPFNAKKNPMGLTEQSEGTLSESGKRWISDLSAQLIQLKIPVNITVEASQKTKSAATSKFEYQVSNDRVWAVSEALRVPLEKEKVSFRIRLGAMGNRPSDIAESVGLQNPIVIRVFYEKIAQDKETKE